MKKIIKISLISMFLILLGCTKEAEFITSFPFEIKETHNITSSINIAERTLFEIVAEDVVETDIFQFKYIVTQGEGHYLDANGERMIENFWYPLTDLVFNLDFIGTTEGDVRPTVTIENTKYTESIQLNYDVIQRSFNYSIATSAANLPIGEGVNLNVAITEIDSQEEDTYTMTYTSSANGFLSIGDQVYQPGTVILLPGLNFSATYFGEETNEHVISTTITAASNDLPITKNISVNYTPTEFTLDITSDNVVTVNDEIEIEFVLNETIGESVFDISYSVTGPEQEIKDSSNVILEKDTNFDVETNTFILTLKAIEQGKTVITWTVTNQFGDKQAKEIEYTINPIPFEFTASVNGSNHLTNEPINFDFDMTASDLITYQMKFESNGNGFVKLNEIDFEPNTFFDITNEDFNLDYFSEKGGVNIITWTIMASNGVTRTQTTNVSVSQFPFITEFSIIDTDMFCDGGFNTLQTININWTKDEQVFIERIVLTWYDDDNNKSEIDIIELDTNRNRLNYFENRCPPGFFIRQNRDMIDVQIFDNLDRESNLIEKRI